MLKDTADGFCMALADSVPGVSGGTVAFIMGFYDQLIGSVNSLIFEKAREKSKGFRYLIRLGIGWAAGMGLAVLILNALFEQNIHMISSLFIGFIIGALPVVCAEERQAVRQWKKGLPFFLAGAFVVVGITLLNTSLPSTSMNLAAFSPVLAIRLFLIGMVAICAMFLPGISGSTMLLIFGAYLPIMQALKELLHLNMSYLPAVLVFMLGLVAGTVSIVKVIKDSLEKFRPQMVGLILGMMAASLYAIVMGPVTLDHPQAPLNLSNFSIPACLIGAALIFLMQVVKRKNSQKASAVSTRVHE